MQYCKVAEDGDFTIEVTEYDDSIQGGSSNQKIVKEQVQYLVKLDTLFKESAVFGDITRQRGFKYSAILKLTERLQPFEICLQAIHKIPIEEVWYVLGVIKRYRFEHVELFRDWFVTWYNRQVVKQALKAQEIICPAWELDAPATFMHNTKLLCYNTVGHIEEKNPIPLRDLHLPPRIMRKQYLFLALYSNEVDKLAEQLNAAKGRLRTLLLRGLFGLNEALLMAKCNCCKETLYDYEKHLFTIGVWPLEKIGNKIAISDILDKLESFSFEPKATGCATCSRPTYKDGPYHIEKVNNYVSHIGKVRTRVRNHFDGLCLDWLDHSKPKTGSKNEDY